eukprot:COSAG06_NODE_2415_length_6914_cov_11.993544_1_plen_182_part_10
MTWTRADENIPEGTAGEIIEIRDDGDRVVHFPSCTGPVPYNKSPAQLLLATPEQVAQWEALKPDIGISFTDPHMFSMYAQACDNGHADVVRLCLAHGADPDAVDQGWPVLCGAALGGHTHVVELLLAAKASVDTPSEDSATSLFVAAQEGHTAVIELLLAAKAAVDTPSQNGTTPLFVAAQE